MLRSNLWTQEKLRKARLNEYGMSTHPIASRNTCEYDIRIQPLPLIRIHIMSVEWSWDGLVLLGAYSTADLSDDGVTVLSVTGDSDGVLDRRTAADNEGNLGEDARELVIPGGNHAQFDSYGPQDGDGAGVALDRVLVVILEEPWFRLLELVDTVVVVYENHAGGFHAAHVCELQLEVDAVPFALGLDLGDLPSKGFHRLGIPGGLSYLVLQLCDAGVAVRNLLLQVGTGRVDCFLRAFLLLILRLILYILRGFLTAIGLTVYIRACLSSS